MTMSPEAVTGERVYRALKSDLLRGGRAPGSVINVRQLADAFDLSISPVRDALHRLIGEDIVALLPGGGFQLPVVDRQLASDLYAWHGKLVLIALENMTGRLELPDTEALAHRIDKNDGVALAELAGQIFSLLGAAGSNIYLALAIERAGYGLQALRVREPRLFPVQSELIELARWAGEGGQAALRRAIQLYHRRRIAKAATLVELLYSPLSL